jgi:hypothetical protein
MSMIRKLFEIRNEIRKQTKNVPDCWLFLNQTWYDIQKEEYDKIYGGKRTKYHPPKPPFGSDHDQLYGAPVFTAASEVEFEEIKKDLQKKFKFVGVFSQEEVKTKMKEKKLTSEEEIFLLRSALKGMLVAFGSCKKQQNRPMWTFAITRAEEAMKIRKDVCSYER